MNASTAVSDLIVLSSSVPDSAQTASNKRTTVTASSVRLESVLASSSVSQVARITTSTAAGSKLGLLEVVTAPPKPGKPLNRPWAKKIQIS